MLLLLVFVTPFQSTLIPLIKRSSRRSRSTASVACRSELCMEVSCFGAGADAEFVAQPYSQGRLVLQSHLGVVSSGAVVALSGSVLVSSAPG